MLAWTFFCGSLASFVTNPEIFIEVCDIGKAELGTAGSSEGTETANAVYSSVW